MQLDQRNRTKQPRSSLYQENTNTSSVSGIPHSGKPDGLLGVYDALRQQWQQPIQTGFHQMMVALQAGLDRIQRCMRYLEMWITCRSTCSV